MIIFENTKTVDEKYLGGKNENHYYFRPNLFEFNEKGLYRNHNSFRSNLFVVKHDKLIHFF
jgi:hypothetical protein